MKFKEFINEFGLKAEYLIAKYEEFKELTGEQKKERVDEALLQWSINILEKVKVNAIFKLCVKTILRIYLPSITQVIFNLIETRIAGITKTGI